MDEDGKQLISSSDMANTVELGGGSELIITKRTDKGTSTKTFGSREYLRYYRQKPRPSPANNVAITAALASRCVFNLSQLALLLRRATWESHLLNMASCIFQVQEHGISNRANKRAHGEDEGNQGDE